MECDYMPINQSESAVITTEFSLDYLLTQLGEACSMFGYKYSFGEGIAS